jgi:large subunit ribosomal protein L4
MKTSLYNQKGENVGEVDLNPKIFEVKPNQHLLAEAVRISQSNARQGSSNTKTRGEVSGGGKKPWKQKGTGRARAGSNRSPIWRHGGVTFGPRANQNWTLKINKKAKTAALFMSLSDKAKENQFIVIDQIILEKAKTKDMAKVLQDLRFKIKDLGKKQMLVMPKKDDKLSRSSRNLPFINTVLASSLNILDVLKADSMIVLKDSLPVIEKIYLKKQTDKHK